MKVTRNFLLFIFLLPLLLYGQRPFINDFVPNGVPVGDTINIIGSNLGSNAIPPRVFFGGVAASSVEFINDRFIRAVVPSGALYGSITVINDNGLLAQSRQNFLLSFHGGNTINTFDDEYIQPAGSNAYDICMCDLDANGLNDIVITHNNAAASSDIDEISIFLNNTTGTGSLSGTDFVRTMGIKHIGHNGGFISTTCADLDLDGLPELLFTTNVGTTNEHIIIYKNSGIVAGELVLTALTGTPLRLPQTSEGNNRTPRRLKVADIDRDGRPDIVVGNEEDNTFHVFKNMTSGGDITFNEDAIEIMITLETSSEGTETGSIDLADFNNDGLVDVVALPFRAPNQPIYVFQNTSVVDEIAFIQAEGISERSRRVNVGTADFDNDGLIDIITTNNRGNEISIYRNITAEEGAEIRFESSGIKIDLSSTSGTLGLWNVDFADFDGDGLVDIVSTSTGFLVTGLSIIKNTSGVSGEISFADPELIETSNTSLNVCAGDLNNDGKPDIAFTHDVAPDASGNLGIFLNRNCVSPEITPDENLSFCLNQDFTLQATHTVGASYQWAIGSSATGSISYVEGDTSKVIISITAGNPADISVTINQDGCSETTTTGFSILNGIVPTQPRIRIAGSVLTDTDVERVCAGSAVTLFITGEGIGAPTNVYEWRLPDGSSSTNPTISFNASAENAGIYSVSVQQNDVGCYSSPSAPFRLEVNELPFVKIVNSVVGATLNFCEGTNQTLNLLTLDGNYSYQWLEDGVGIPEEESDALDIDQTGDYSVMVTDNDVDCNITSPIYSARRLPSPRVNVMGRSNVCAGDNEIYTSLATGARGFPLEYSWKIDSAGGIEIFNSGRQDDLETITRSFSLYDNYRITHTASYSTDQISPLCFDDTTFAVISSPAPEITFNVKNDTFKCPLDTILVEVINPAPNNVDTYEWFVNNANRNADTSFLQVYVPRSENIDSVYAKVSSVNDIGCSVTDSVRIINYDTTSLKIDTEIESLIAGDTTVESITYPLILLSADNSVELLATGGSDYNWDPAASIDNPTGNSVTFYPVRPLSFVSLNGKDANGCENSYSVAVILNNVRPRSAITVTTQAEVNALNTNIDTIDGNLTIGYTDGSSSQSNITDLTPLSNMTHITGNLIIRQNGQLVNLDDLDNLQSIGGIFRVEDNAKLTTLGDFTNLQTIGESFSVSDNDTLITLGDFTNLQSIGGNFEVGGNYQLTTLADFPNLQSIGGVFWVNGNYTLTTMGNFSALTSIGIGGISVPFLNFEYRDNVSIVVENNPGLSNCCVLARFLNQGNNRVEGNTYITNNAAGCDENTIQNTCRLIVITNKKHQIAYDNIDPISISFTVRGGAMGWTSDIVYTPAGADFITLSSTEGRDQTGAITITATPVVNTSVERTATITLTTTGIGTPVTQTIVITQGEENTPNINIPNINIPNTDTSNTNTPNTNTPNTPDTLNTPLSTHTKESIFTLYPNPTKGTLTIEGVTGYLQMHIYDLVGREVMTYSLTPSKKTIDVSDLPSGMYVVTLRGEDKTWTEVLIIVN